MAKNGTYLAKKKRNENGRFKNEKGAMANI
jgi:hypothetical protein